MRFLSWGDYMIPFSWGLYWAKHFYIWSFQSGTPNPDGLIRLPGRLLNFLVFGASGNVGVGYFYSISSLIVAFVAFFFFARRFLHIKRTSVQLLGALFFACNPIFLGNLAKVGLVLAASMLPLCFLAIRAAFVQKRFRYFLLYILCLNLSFLHPYTFTVNTAVSGAYLLWMAWQHRAWVRDTWLKFVVIGLFGVAANLYFVLPMLSVGTVSKDVISTNITPVAVDYTALVGVSNTGDLFTGFSLSKNVFVDFAFYNSTYQNVYFFGVFLLYVLLLGLYIYTEKRLNITDKRRLGVLFGSFLLLLLLAATTVARFDELIKFLISLPGGWAFRSPLKWQLYIPLALFGIVVILLNRVPGKMRLLAFQAGLMLSFVIMNAYLVFDIHQKLLTSRSPEYFAGLAHTNMDGKTVLFVNNGACMDFMRGYPRVTTEINQIFGSKYVQLKHVLEDSIEGINMASYDYVLTCESQLQPQLAAFDFKPIGQFVDGTFRLYANQKPVPAVAVSDRLYHLADQERMADKYQFVTTRLATNFGFVPDQDHPLTTLQDVFAKLRPQDITEGKLTAQIGPGKLLLPANETLFYRLGGQALDLSPAALPGFQPAPSNLVLPGPQYNVTYQDESIRPNNIVPNASFEQGLWQGTVGDCYAYDDKPDIGMQLSTQMRADGRQALELWARSHIACTGPDALKVTSDDHYLLSFTYQDPGGKYAGYYISFNDPAETVVTERLQHGSQNWQTFSKEISVPTGATSLRLLLYAFPDPYSLKRQVVHYDEVSLLRIPPAQNRFYRINEQTGLQQPAGMTFRATSPTRTVVQIEGARKPFYLTTHESYHPMWQAEVLGTRPKIQLPFMARHAVRPADHVRLNGTMNGWYIDPTKLCAQTDDCVRHADGSYDFTLALEFVPQRWFYFGGTLSALTLLAGIMYYLYDRRQGERHIEGRWQWHR